MKTADELRLPALEVRQGERRIYTFACEGKQVPLFAAISRVKRDEGNAIDGYQRPEVSSHISEIKRYLESPNPMLPNAIVIAFDERVRFESSTRWSKNAYSRPGTLVIPFVDGGESKPGWIVDGQQRTAAIREARVASFPICVTGFIANQDDEQRRQFILVNSTKPLPKGLIYELLPVTDGTLPTRLLLRRFPAQLLERLNHDPVSPLFGMIRTPTAPDGIVKDNSVLRMIENSLSDGALYMFRDPDTGTGDVDRMMSVLFDFWTAVRKVFEPAWGLPPRKSRLMHGVGIVSLGFVMDAIIDRHRRQGLPTLSDFVADLQAIEEVCHWTQGFWSFGENTTMKWNALQNTPKDIQMVTNYLLGEYKSRVWIKHATSQTRLRPKRAKPASTKVAQVARNAK